jgi:hypothetical protein
MYTLVCPVFTGNTFQDSKNTERYIKRDICVTNINTVKFIDKYGLSEHKHCDNAATNANSENTRSRMEASSAGKSEYEGKGR